MVYVYFHVTYKPDGCSGLYLEVYINSHIYLISYVHMCYIHADHIQECCDVILRIVVIFGPYDFDVLFACMNPVAIGD